MRTVMIRVNGVVEDVDVPEPFLDNLEAALGGAVQFQQIANTFICYPNCFAMREDSYLDNAAYNYIGSAIYGSPVYGDAAIVRIPGVVLSSSAMAEEEANGLVEEVWDWVAMMEECWKSNDSNNQ